MAHIAAMELGIELWQEFSTVGTKHAGFECIEGLPEGAEFLYSYVDDLRRIAIMVFQHPSFDDVRLGESVPRIDLALRALSSEKHSA